MAGEQAAQPALVTTFAKPQKSRLQDDCTQGVVAGFRHIAHTVFVGFELGAATVFHHQHLCADLGSADDQVGVVAVISRNTGCENPDLRQHAA